MNTVAVQRPDGQREIDIKKYVKVEKIPGGSTEDCRVLKGVMFNKVGDRNSTCSALIAAAACVMRCREVVLASHAGRGWPKALVAPKPGLLQRGTAGEGLQCMQSRNAFLFASAPDTSSAFSHKSCVLLVAGCGGAGAHAAEDSQPAHPAAGLPAGVQEGGEPDQRGALQGGGLVCLCFLPCFSPVKTLPSNAFRRAGRGREPDQRGAQHGGGVVRLPFQSEAINWKR